MTAIYDHIVVGAGAAGSLIAARLAEDCSQSIALLEAGGDDRHFWVPIPLGYAQLANDPAVNWGYRTGPEPGLGGRQIPWPRGRLLGGSASINGLVWLRGAPEDFDGWARAGAAGWGHADVLPVFRRLERCHMPGVDPAWHGFDGPMPVSAIARPSAVARAFVAACEQLGFTRNDDFNGATLDGTGFLPLNTERGRRRTSAMTILKPALAGGARIDLRLHATVRRIVFDGRRACGIDMLRADGSTERLHCRGEIILAAGAINSPQLLLASGIGDADDLQRLGRDVVQPLAGVGRNLQDHLMARFVFRATRRDTLNDVMQSRWRQLGAGLDYLLHRRGPLAVSAAEASLFARFGETVWPGPDAPPPDPDRQPQGPDVQYQVANFSLDSYQTGLHRFPGFVYSACVCRPASRGRIRLDPAAPDGPPLIAANYLTDARDIRLMLAAFRLGRRIAGATPLRDLIAEEVRPGPAITDDDALLDYIRNTASTTFHPCGSCAIGDDHNALAVVDPQLRVRGIAGLRVIDASVMPVIPSANIHAATLMIAERGASFTRADRNG